MLKQYSSHKMRFRHLFRMVSLKSVALKTLKWPHFLLFSEQTPATKKGGNSCNECERIRFPQRLYISALASLISGNALPSLYESHRKNRISSYSSFCPSLPSVGNDLLRPLLKPQRRIKPGRRNLPESDSTERKKLRNFALKSNQKRIHRTGACQIEGGPRTAVAFCKNE